MAAILAAEVLLTFKAIGIKLLCTVCRL